MGRDGHFCGSEGQRSLRSAACRPVTHADGTRAHVTAISKSHPIRAAVSAPFNGAALRVVPGPSPTHADAPATRIEVAAVAGPAGSSGCRRLSRTVYPVPRSAAPSPPARKSDATAAPSGAGIRTLSASTLHRSCFLSAVDMSLLIVSRTMFTVCGRSVHPEMSRPASFSRQTNSSLWTF